MGHGLFGAPGTPSIQQQFANSSMMLRGGFDAACGLDGCRNLSGKLRGGDKARISLGILRKSSGGAAGVACQEAPRRMTYRWKARRRLQIRRPSRWLSGRAAPRRGGQTSRESAQQRNARAIVRLPRMRSEIQGRCCSRHKARVRSHTHLNQHDRQTTGRVRASAASRQWTRRCAQQRTLPVPAGDRRARKEEKPRGSYSDAAHALRIPRHGSVTNGLRFAAYRNQGDSPCPDSDTAGCCNSVARSEGAADSVQRIARSLYGLCSDRCLYEGLCLRAECATAPLATWGRGRYCLPVFHQPGRVHRLRYCASICAQNAIFSIDELPRKRRNSRRRTGLFN